MKRIVHIVVVFLYLATPFALAQEDAVSQFLNEETKIAVIKKSRELLLDKFLERDTNKVKEIEHYLNTLANEDYLTLEYHEQWLIDYWTNDFQNIFQSIDQITLTNQSIDYRLTHQSIDYLNTIKIRPSNDYLFIKLQEKMYLQRNDIEHAISTSILSQSDKDFLVIHFYSCLKDGIRTKISQDTINELSDIFIQKYPDNNHIGFLRNSIRFKYVPSNWGLGTAFFSGYGFLTNNIKNHFSNFVPWGLSIDISYKKVVLSLAGSTGVGHTLHDFSEHTVVWPQNSTYNYDIFDVSLGYVVHDGKHFKLEPFVGFSSSGINPAYDDIDKQPYLDEYKSDFATYKIGLNLDYNFRDPFSFLMSELRDESSTVIRLQYAYCLPQLSRSHPEFVGNMHTITLGIGGFGRNTVRDY